MPQRPSGLATSVAGILRKSRNRARVRLMPHFVAIVPAAGSSTRFGRNKLLEALDGVSVLHRPLLALANHASCSAIYLATSDNAVVAHAHELDAAHKPIHLCRGGATRADS